jgi:hypothetical protein
MARDFTNRRYRFKHYSDLRIKAANRTNRASARAWSIASG